MIEDSELITTDEVREHRISLCKTCEKFTIENEMTVCSECNCSCSMLFTYNFKSCPLGKW